jgi:hypothetical protein
MNAMFASPVRAPAGPAPDLLATIGAGLDLISERQLDNAQSSKGCVARIAANSPSAARY